MTDSETTFRQAELHESFLEFQKPDDLSLTILDKSKYYNESMAKRLHIDIAIIETFPEPLKSLMLNNYSRLPLLLAGIDDHRATLAIEAKGQETTVGQQLPEQKKSFLDKIRGK